MVQQVTQEGEEEMAGGDKMQQGWTGSYGGKPSPVDAVVLVSGLPGTCLTHKQEMQHTRDPSPWN
jgi:hypothetical protein